MCLCFVFREIDDQSSRSTSASTDKSSSRTPSGTSKDWCVVGEHYVCKEEMRGSDFEDCRNCVSEKEYRECIKNHWSNKSTDSSRNTSGTSNDSTDIDQREGANYIGSAKENIHRVVRLEMAAGDPRWWHYLVHVDRFGAQIRVEIEDKDGVRKVDGVLYNIGPDDLVKLFPEMSDKPEWVDDDHWSEFSWHEL